MYVADALVYHVGSATTGKKSDFSTYYGHRNLVWCYLKNMPGWMFWVYVPQHVLMNLFTIFAFILAGRGKVILRSKFDAVKGIRKALSQRKDIQKIIKISPSTIRKQMQTGLISLLNR